MVEIETKLYNDIKLYCKINNLVIKDFINKLLKKAFMVEKYGERPFAPSPSMNVINETPQSEPLSKLEEEAIEKIKDMVENQFDMPVEIAEAMEEVDFFELLGDEKNDNTRISITTNNENRERVNKTQTTDTTSSTEEKEEMKPIKKSRKRKL